MTTAADADIVRWSARTLAVVVALLVGAFALDSVGEGVGPFLMHAAPSLVLLVIVAISWQREWVGGVVFVAAAAFYAFTTRRMDWVLLIAGPLLLVGMLYLWSWRRTPPAQQGVRRGPLGHR